MLEAEFSFDAENVAVGSPLRTLSWAELRARLDAAQQLRGVLAARATQAVIEAAGRFEVNAAQQALMPAGAADKGKPSVNPDPSINSKDESGIAVSEVTERAETARGQE